MLPQETLLTVLFLGLQSQLDAKIESAVASFLAIQGQDAPLHSDQATFSDSRGYLNRVVALYWHDARSFGRWRNSLDMVGWRQKVADGGVGLWWEPIVLHAPRMETIAFKEFRRGFSGCPRSELEPTYRSGYWGAARDRIPGAADDLFEPSIEQIDPTISASAASNIVAIKPPANMAVIRSGVSWEHCEGEQLKDYEEKIRPKLDAGMEYLRTHPRETGCFSLRQVTAVGNAGAALSEGYSLGHFVSMGHLEAWAKDHPTHLAIYTRAMAARRKYQEQLQLRTYNEIFIVPADNPAFEYVGCHSNTGLLPFHEVLERHQRR